MVGRPSNSPHRDPVNVGYADAAHRTIMTRIKACQSGSRGAATDALTTKRLVATSC
jgi:hypothetical protein